MRKRHRRQCKLVHPRRSASRAGFNGLELVFALCVIGLLVALLLPAVRRDIGPAVRRSKCRINLQQIALALRNYEGKYGAFPPAFTVDTDGRPLHSWRTLLLPFLGEAKLYGAIDLSKPWDDPANAALLERVPKYYRCPTVEEPTSLTTYVAVVGPNACFLPRDSRELAEFTDSLSDTLMVVEVSPDAAVPWMAPQDGGAEFVLNFGDETRMPHDGGFHAAFAEVFVRILFSDLSDADRAAMISIDGNESIEEW